MKRDETPVLINLLAVAKYDHMPDYPIQMMTRGSLKRVRKGIWELRYTETDPEEEGLSNSSEITLRVEPHQVMMNRVGPYSNTMVFSAGKRFEGIYVTPYGEMDMAVTAREVQSRTGERNGSLHLKYQLDIQGNYASTNELHLEYFEEPVTLPGEGSETHETAAE